MKQRERYSYERSVKSRLSDELINTFALRPLAGILVHALYRSPVTPNHVTVAATITGLLAAWFYSRGNPWLTFAAGLCVTVKDILDSADGQLARAKKMYSRTGRFLDSIGDIVVNASVFIAISITLSQSGSLLAIGTMCGIAFIGLTLRVSYHVFYQTSFLHMEKQYSLNRLSETLNSEDLSTGKVTLLLQRVFLLLYGWQDRMMISVDSWCRNGLPRTRTMNTYWYGDTTGMRLSGMIGMGTELFLLALCSITDRLGLYLYLNIIMMNAFWGMSILYRRYLLSTRLAGTTDQYSP